MKLQASQNYQTVTVSYQEPSEFSVDLPLWLEAGWRFTDARWYDGQDKDLTVSYTRTLQLRVEELPWHVHN